VLANDFVAQGLDPDRVTAMTEFAAFINSKDVMPRDVFVRGLMTSESGSFTAGVYTQQTVVSDVAELDPVIERIIAANPGQAEQYRGGKEGLLGFFVGQVLKESGGTADPKVVSERLREKLRA
jgi:Asp-tRNA(Asn)/Glu-tRNA(Gln) amidotransferase B subunit